jgi:hypothetical protein
MTNVLVSADVSSGQPTSAAQFNNLRADALRFGAAAADASTINLLLSRFSSGLTLVALGSQRVRVPALPSAVVCIVIDGFPCYTTANVDLPNGSAPSGSANTYYVFAVHSGGSTSFTLDCNTSSTESTNRRCIGQFYWDGSKIVLNSIQTADKAFYATVLNQGQLDTAQGRLTLTSGTPVTVTDVTGGTVYYTPYNGNSIGLYVPGMGWKAYNFSELSISLVGTPINKNVDIFVYDNAGVMALDSSIWSTDTSRSVALALQDGINVMSTSHDRRYVGTVRTSSSNTAEDSNAKRFVWNAYNRVPRKLFVTDATASWTYTTVSFRQANANVANQVGVLIGLPQSTLSLKCSCMVGNTSSAHVTVGIGEDNTTTSQADVHSYNPVASLASTDTADLVKNPALGYHYYAWLERSSASGTTTWYTQNSDTWPLGSGLLGTIDA